VCSTAEKRFPFHPRLPNWFRSGRYTQRTCAAERFTLYSWKKSLNLRNPSTSYYLCVELQDTAKRMSQPSQLHYALACAILKSKPDDISVRGMFCVALIAISASNILDFILQLRHSVKSVPLSGSRITQQHYVDEVARWKRECERAKAANVELHTRIISLLRKLDEADSANTGISPPLQITKRKSDQNKSFTTTSRPTKQPKSGTDYTVSENGRDYQNPAQDDHSILSTVGNGTINPYFFESLLTQ
jgi:hypothetical protein